MKDDFNIQIESSNLPPQEAETRLLNALNMLINLNDIYGYEQQKNNV